MPDSTIHLKPTTGHVTSDLAALIQNLERKLQVAILHEVSTADRMTVKQERLDRFIGRLND